FGDRKFLQSFFVESKRSPGGNRNFPFDDKFPFDNYLLFSRKLEPEPDAHACEDQRYQAAVDLDRVFYHDIAVFNDLKPRDQQPATKPVDEPIDENLFLHVASPWRTRV